MYFVSMYFVSMYFVSMYFVSMYYYKSIPAFSISLFSYLSIYLSIKNNVCFTCYLIYYAYDACVALTNIQTKENIQKLNYISVCAKCTAIVFYVVFK